MKTAWLTKTAVRLATVLMVLLLAGCTKKEFKVSFALPPSVNDNYTMLYYASDRSKGWLTDAVAVVKGGKCESHCATVNPTLVYLFKGGNEPALIFYAERGDKIEISGDNDMPATWRVSGNDINDEMTAWRVENRDVLSGRDPVRINAAVSKYVSAHPELPSAALILYLYYDRGEDEKGYGSLYKKLKDDATSAEWSELTGRNDLLAGYAPHPLKVGDIILRTAGTGCDTLRLTKTPALLYFAENTADSRREDILALKRAIRERKDSASRLVASISLEGDSMSWSYQVSLDSLRGAVQGWIPMSYADSVAKALGVTRSPLFLVTSKGRIIYRGSDADKAVGSLLKAP